MLKEKEQKLKVEEAATSARRAYKIIEASHERVDVTFNKKEEQQNIKVS